MKANLPDLRHLGYPGAEIALRVTPRASASRMTVESGQIRVAVTAAPEKGRANAAVAKLLAKAVGLPPSHLVLLRGQTGRDKLFRVMD
ncbi:MAG: DUF167 domain-containing protein [Paracoccus denitrificans]|uniref:UPF0235 protein DI616_04510 n=1 Tax=Paracoccus denitrificans TaxID=266 RepID=A0A533I7N4_PARDE|nr:MAG: DUF167 domain-containing protein [Paracoccus denitrificans]